MMMRFSSMTSVALAILLLLAVFQTEAFTTSVDTYRGSSSKSSRIYYRNDNPAESVTENQVVVVEPRTIIIPQQQQPLKKPTIYPLTTLQEFYDFLKEDDRLTAVKFYAPWCKKCQHVGLHFKKLAHDMGDGVVARKQVAGTIRCAEVEYSEVTAGMMDALQIKAVPTLHLYRGTTLLWSADLGKEPSSSTSSRSSRRGSGNAVQDLSREISRLLQLSPQQLARHVAELADDPENNIVEQAMEDSFFDSAYCYDWEDHAQCL